MHFPEYSFQIGLNKGLYRHYSREQFHIVSRTESGDLSVMEPISLLHSLLKSYYDRRSLANSPAIASRLQT